MRTDLPVDHVLEDWMLDAATAHTRDLLANGRVKASSRLETIVIQVLSRVKGKNHAGVGGFAEIGLE